MLMPGYSRKRLLGWLPALALAGLLALAGALAATGRLDLAGLLKSQPDDAEVVVVEGFPVTRAEVYGPVALRRSFAPEFTEEELLKRTIIDQVAQLLVRAEIQRRGLMPSMEEAREFMSTEREWCSGSGSGGAECREALRSFGYDPQADEYWEAALADFYQYELGRLRLVDQLSQERGDFPARPGKVDEYGYAQDPFLEELRENAAIEWHDKRLERLYEHALLGRPILRR